MRFTARKGKLQAVLTLASAFLFDSVLAFDSASSVNATSQCYFPGGAFSTGQACTPDAPTSLCCGPGFSCLSNGVCQATATASNHSSEYFRPTCTDQSWDSPDCPQFCNGAEDNRKGGQGLQVCDLISGTYCCKRDVDCCSNSTLAFTLGHGTQVKVIPSIADPATKSTPTAMSTNNTMSMPEPSSDGSGGSSPVGIAIGLTITILILLAFAVIYYMRRRKRSRQTALVTEEVKSMGSPASTSSAFSKGPSVTSSVISAPIELGNLPSDNVPQVPGAIRQHRRAAAASPIATTSPSLADPPSIPPRNPARMTLRSRDSSLEQFRQTEASRSRPTTPVGAQPEADAALPIVREDIQQEALATTTTPPPNNTPVITSPLQEAIPSTGNFLTVQPTPSQTYLTVPQPPRPHNSMEITEVPRQGTSDAMIFERHGAGG